MSTIGLKLTISCPKQCSVIEKVKPHRARILFLEKLKTCSKWFAQSIFFHPQLCLNWSLQSKNKHNWTKIDDLVTKTMFGDRINLDTFLELGKNLSKLVRSVQTFNFITNCC